MKSKPADVANLFSPSCTGRPLVSRAHLCAHRRLDDVDRHPLLRRTAIGEASRHALPHQHCVEFEATGWRRPSGRLTGLAVAAGRRVTPHVSISLPLLRISVPSCQHTIAFCGVPGSSRDKLRHVRPHVVTITWRLSADRLRSTPRGGLSCWSNTAAGRWMSWMSPPGRLRRSTVGY